MFVYVVEGADYEGGREETESREVEEWGSCKWFWRVRMLVLCLVMGEL